MTRPLWADKAPDVQAVAAHLAASAEAATGPLVFQPVALPAGADRRILHQAALARARDLLAKSHGEADRILAQEVRAIDDLVRTANLLVERLREWYALHAPEATRLTTDAETLARLVSEVGERGAVMAALDQAKAAESSLGSDLAPADMVVIRSFATTLAAVHTSWHALEARVVDLMTDVAPNLGSVVGPVIGARMIAQAGSLERLASWPAGTVQTLGAETALFRHLKEGTKPPKHGILFQHPTVHAAPQWQRGPIARSLALAACLAAKADAFTKNDLRASLMEGLERDLARIRSERARAPERVWSRGPGAGGRHVGARPMAPRYGAGADAPRYGGGARGPQGGGGYRGPPREGGGSRGPPREGGYRGPPRDGRGPPREGGFGGPPRDGRGPPRDGPRGPPRDGGYGGASSGPPRGWQGRDDATGPPRPSEGGGWRGPRGGGDAGGSSPGSVGGDAPRAPGGFKRDGPGSFARRRKGPGAFRNKDGGPAAPPGKGG